MESPVPEGHILVLNIWLGVGSVVNRRLTYPVAATTAFARTMRKDGSSPVTSSARTPVTPPASRNISSTGE